MGVHKATFANYILHFGDRVLVDYLESIVIPAFLDDRLIRTYRDVTTYRFHDASVVVLEHGDPPLVGIAGRLVKDTVLSREQIFVPEKGLIRDEQSIASSPSSFFLLLLNNHRLVYVPETAHAPDLSAFKTTSAKFLREKHKQYINYIYDAEKEAGKSVTKRSLLDEHGYPSLEVIPLTSTEDIETFVEGYDILESVTFRMVKPNEEIDGAEVFREVREFLGSMNPRNTRIITRNADGLDKQGVVNVIHAAAAAGNQEVTLVGKDGHGNKMTGNNDEFKVVVEIRELPATKLGLTRSLYSLFRDLVEDGRIKVDQQTAAAKQKIADTLAKLMETL